MDVDATSMWFVSRELQKDQRLMDTPSIGKNERTTIIVKLSKRGGGPPSREPVMDTEQQKKIMAYWYKKQEETKKLLEDDDDNFVNSAWANPNSLKSAFQGIGNISMPNKK